jgi:hypothetical protein
MEERDIETLRDKVPCAALLESKDWKIDLKESTRRAIKYRYGEGKIIIVIHDGRGWFDPLSEAKGDVFSLAEHLGAEGFGGALACVADLVGFTPTMPAWRKAARVRSPVSLLARWRTRPNPYRGSPTWRYLTELRALPPDVVKTAVACDHLREGPYGSMWAAHTDAAGVLTGWEERGPHWRGFAAGGGKELFRFGASDATRICVTEAAIDAMSLAVIEVERPDTLYVSTCGGWSTGTDEAIRGLAKRPNARLVAATDNNRQGDVYADRIRTIAAEARADYARSRPHAGDWNEDLKGRVKRQQNELVPESG